jgi:hypothetical protein
MKSTLVFRPCRMGCVIPLVFSAVLCDCVGATRLPVRATSPAGAAIQKKEINLNFLQAGSTHREEVENQLSAINTTYSNPRLFWGRWGESKWGFWWVVAVPCTSNCAAGDAKRIWHVRNLLVTYDENGLVTSKETIPDEKKFWRSLHSRMVKAPPPPLDLAQPVRVELTTPEPVAILLGKDHIELEQSNSDAPNVQTPIMKIARFSHGTSLNKKSSPGVTCHTLEFSEKTVFGKKVRFCAEANQIGILFQYLQQAGPQSMAWQ